MGASLSMFSWGLGYTRRKSTCLAVEDPYVWRFPRPYVLFLLSSCKKYLSTYTCVADESEQHRIDALVAIVDLAAVLVEIEKKIDMHTSDDRQLTGAFNLHANFVGFLQLTTDAVQQMVVFLQWAKDRHIDGINEVAPRTIDVHYVATLHKLTEIAISLTEELTIILNEPEKCAVLRNADAMGKKPHVEIVDQSFSSALQKYGASSPRSKAEIKSCLKDLHKATIAFYKKVRDRAPAEEQFLQSLQAMKIASAPNSPRESLARPSTPTTTISQAGSPATSPLQLYRKKGGKFFVISPSSIVAAGTYRSSSAPKKGTPCIDVDAMVDYQNDSPCPSPVNRGSSKKQTLPPSQPGEGHPVSVLIVDDLNGDRSCWVHAYLEQMRFSMYGSLRQWPFDCIDSAGLCISTPFSKPYLAKAKLARGIGRSPSDRVINMVLGHLSAPLSEVESTEEFTVRAWLKQHKAQGVQEAHFRHYDYILCFEKEHHEVLLEMQRVVKASVESGCSLSGDVLQSCQVVLMASQMTSQTLASSSKDAAMSVHPAFTWQEMAKMHVMESFLMRKLGWYHRGWDAMAGAGPLASRHMGVEWGTHQFTLPEGSCLETSSHFWNDKLYTMELEMDCILHLGHLSMSKVAWICGPRANHEKAESMIHDWIEESTTVISDEDD